MSAAPKPVKKFKFTEPMRMYLYSIMTSSGLISEAKIAKAWVFMRRSERLERPTDSGMHAQGDREG